MWLFNTNSRIFNLVVIAVASYAAYDAFKTTSQNNSHYSNPPLTQGSVTINLDDTKPYSERSFAEKFALYWYKEEIEKLKSQNASALVNQSAFKDKLSVVEGSTVFVKVVEEKHHYADFKEFIVGSSAVDERERLIAEKIIGLKIGEKVVFDTKKFGQLHVYIADISTNTTQLVQKDSIVEIVLLNQIQDTSFADQALKIEMQNPKNDLEKNLTKHLLGRPLSDEFTFQDDDKKFSMIKIISIKGPQDDQ